MDVPCSHVALKINDVLFEILVRANPYDIFNCILVSKDWLCVITNSAFWTNYLNVWKNSSRVTLGLLRTPYELFVDKFEPMYYSVKLLATNNIGRNMTRHLTLKSEWGGKEMFISKSPKDGIILLGHLVPKTRMKTLFGAMCNVFQKKEKFPIRLYVCNPFSGSRPIKLSSPPVNYKKFMANIISCDGGEFKVILARSWYVDDKVKMQIYCSRTRKWEEQFTPRCTTYFKLNPFTLVQSGIVSNGNDAIYWRACKGDYSAMCIAMWDINEGRLTLIPQPPEFNINGVYGAHGSGLLAATGDERRWRKKFNWDSDLKIWALDDDKKDWSLLYSIHQESTWNKNLQVLTSLFKVKPEFGFKFVSFFPGKSYCFLVGICEQMFIYHFDSDKLEHVEYAKYNPHSIHLSGAHDKYHPLTMLDFKGPSSPSCLQLPHLS